MAAGYTAAMFVFFILLFVFVIPIQGVCNQAVWNNPYEDQEVGDNTLYGAFTERPKHLDPARSYSANEWKFIQQIYEPPLQYHYLKRPYELEPLLAKAIPKVVLLDDGGGKLGAGTSASGVRYSLYEIEIKSGVQFQPHPALVDAVQSLEKVHSLADFKQVGTRSLVADDFIYQIKRLAHPGLNSPIYGLMSEYIVGLKALRDELDIAWDKQGKKGWLDLRNYSLEGVKRLGAHRYQIKLKGVYPQFLYWLTMPFFAPVPYEADRFYSREGMASRNLSMDWFPLGTGPYMLTENNPNRRMVLRRNPNFHGERYPTIGPDGLLADAGQPMPFINRAVYSLEKETIPSWNKFLQGWYDASEISSDSFDQAVNIGGSGDIHLTEEMQTKGLQLSTEVSASILYLGFNWLDPVVGGHADSARKLRQAISVAVDYEEYVSIFRNGRGLPSQGPLPPGIFGHRSGEQGVNTQVYDWQGNQAVRKPLSYAKTLLAEAGYADGIDPVTGKPLLLALDVMSRAGPDSKAQFDWWRKQLAKIGLRLVVRDTDYNRFQDKMRKGKAQLFLWGWNADYPDPENFFFLLYGANGKVNHGGENAANYSNPKFDQLFDQMKVLPNGVERQQRIDEMVDLVRRDAPWVWGFHPVEFNLNHRWVKNVKANMMSRNTLKYRRIDNEDRAIHRQQWNQPVIWPLYLLVLLALLVLYPAWRSHKRRENSVIQRDKH